jgi:iron(III) transport system substrate-binding protein
MKVGAHPVSARLLQSFMFSAAAQQEFIDGFVHRSLHAEVKEKPGRVPLSAIKILRADPAPVLKQTEEIKARYARIFGV